MTQIYEGMFVLDNELVRGAGWAKAKSTVTDLLAKHGGTVHTARRWAERKLAYPIKKRNRATYVLCYYEIPSEGIASLIRDLDLSEPVLRYLLLKVDAVPARERELSSEEATDGYEIPEPPADEVGRYQPVQVEGADEDEGSEEGRPGESEGSEVTGASAPATPKAAPADSTPGDAGETAGSEEKPVAVAADAPATAEAASAETTKESD